MRDSGTVTARAKRWGEGWELHIEGWGVTQSRTLARAEDQVRDYIETVTEEPADTVEVSIVPELGDLGIRVKKVRAETVRIAKSQEHAAQATREVVRDLRDAGLSTADIAAVMHVSRGRVSQWL